MISDPEDILSNTRVSEKAVNNNKLYCGDLTYFAQQPWSFSSPCAGHQNVDLKQTDCQIFLQEKKNSLILNQQRIWGLQAWQATYKPLQLQGKESTFMEGRGHCEDCSPQRALGFSLAQFLKQKKRILSSSSWALLSSLCMGSPLSGLPTLSNWGFVY